VNRRPQVPVRVMRAGVRGLVRPVLGPRMPVAVQRRWLRVVTGPTPLAEDVAIRSGRLGRRPAETLIPSAGDPTTAVLYLHGGGFTTGSPATHRALATHLAAASGATVHVLDYRLAPEHPPGPPWRGTPRAAGWPSPRPSGCATPVIRDRARWA
jgi:monoterpene epsilon-lactone hydrolase